MSFSGWLITGAIFIIILVVALGIGWWIRNRSNPTPTPANPFLAPLTWSNPEPGPNTDKNSCQLYQFPTAVVDLGGIPTAIPGTPTFNEDILNGLTGRPVLPFCIDSDQIIAQQVEHTCTAPEGVVDSAITRCFLISGGTTGLSGTETYFTNSGCPNIPPCAGQLSLVSINFQAPGVTGIFCLQSQGSGANIVMAPCDPANPNQLFRVTRTNPGQNPLALEPGQGQNGLIAQILDRNTGLCVIPGTGTTTTLFDPAYLTPVQSSCVGPIQSLTGPNVILGACTGGQFPGYVWALIPSIPFCSVTGGCPGCTGCFGCQRLQGSNVCQGCPTCHGAAATPTPPQITYVGNLKLNEIPIGPTGFAGLTGPSAIVQWLISNDAQSLYFGGTGNGLILRDFGLDVTMCIDKPFTAQYLNLVTFNTLSVEEVCLAEGILATPTCVSL